MIAGFLKLKHDVGKGRPIIEGILSREGIERAETFMSQERPKIWNIHVHEEGEAGVAIQIEKRALSFRRLRTH